MELLKAMDELLTRRKPKILLAAMGSHGDLNPMIAIGQALQALGAEATVSASLAYRQKIVDAGLDFAPLRPDMPTDAEMASMAEELFDPRSGTQAIIERFAMPFIEQSWSDTLAAAQGCDAIIAGALCMAAPMAAHRLGIPWASAALQPMAHFSAFDPPTLPAAPWLEATRNWGIAGVKIRKALFQAAKIRTRPWCAPHARLRRDLGLPAEPYPLFSTSRSKWLCLSMFPSYFAPSQPDWPASNVICGFPRATPIPSECMPEELARFLDHGEAPLTFTLGTAAVHAAGRFYQEAKACAASLGMRAVFLTGRNGINAMGELPDSMIAVPYAPHSLLFPKSRAIAHSCGIGTCAAALASGAPSLAVPWANDQPDNARRLELLGAARLLPREKFNAARAAEHFLALQRNPAYRLAASRIAAMESHSSNGAAAAAKVLLAKLAQAS